MSAYEAFALKILLCLSNEERLVWLKGIFCGEGGREQEKSFLKDLGEKTKS